MKRPATGIGLFEKDAPPPLAARMRPRTLEEFVGQEHIVGPGHALRRAIENDVPGHFGADRSLIAFAESWG